MAVERICVAAIAGAHGVRGLVKLRSFTEDPEAVAAYGPLTDEAGRRRFHIRLKGKVKDLLLAQIDGVADRDQAQALRGTRLYVARAALPAIEEEDTYYHADLIGMEVVDPAGRPLGRLRGVANHGAGDLLEIDGTDGRELLLPFTRAVVPQVDLAAGRLVAVLPDEILVRPDVADKDAESSS